MELLGVVYLFGLIYIHTSLSYNRLFIHVCISTCFGILVYACMRPSIHTCALPPFLVLLSGAKSPFPFLSPPPSLSQSSLFSPHITSPHLSPFPFSPPRYSLRPKQMINPLLLPTSPRRAPDQRILAPIVLRERDDIPHGGHVA